MGMEEGKPDGCGHHESHGDLGRQPAQVLDRDDAMEGKSYEVANEEQLPSEKAPRAETPQVGAHRENQRDDCQGEDTMTADADPQSQGRNERDGEDEECDYLSLGRWI